MTARITTIMLTLLAVAPLGASEEPSPDPVDVEVEADSERPLIEGGIYDKPFMFEAFGGRTVVGGYLDMQLRNERGEGVTETSFVAERFNLFTFAMPHDRIRIAAELEIEEWGEEIKLELAILDFEIHPALTVRTGLLLAPLGYFNLAHDSPANDLVDRPLVATELLGATLTEAGMGVLGHIFPVGDFRLTYEVYAVNGFSDGVITASDAGTRIPAGRRNLDDINSVPSVVGRLGISPHPNFELGLSAHHGAYNTSNAEDLEVDESRDLTLLALDFTAHWRFLELVAEYAQATIEIPDSLVGLFAEGQEGYYVELRAHFLEGVFDLLPDSTFTGTARFGGVDFDVDVDGDSHRRLTVGLNFRPIPETVFKLDYQRDWIRDRQNIEVPAAAVLFGAATYF